MQMAYNKETPVYAGFFIRLAAFLIDMLLVNVVLCVIKVPVWFLKLSMGDSILFQSILFEYNVFDILYYVLTATYFVLSTYCCGATLGKYLMKIKVVSVDGEQLSFLTVLIRETVGRYLSAIIIYIGYIVAGLDHRKQGLHDRISDTCVVYKMMYQKSKGTPIMQNGAPVQENPAVQDGEKVEQKKIPEVDAVVELEAASESEKTVERDGALQEEKVSE